MTYIPLHFSNDAALQSYLNEVHNYPTLDADEEYTLASEWVNKKSKPALDRLVKSHLRMASKIASGFRGYGLPLSDLIAEANIGILIAANKFDPEKGFRFSTYARWWIQAAVQEYVLKSWSMVKIGTTAAQKKLFFNLRKLKNQLGVDPDKSMSPQEIKSISSSLDVSEKEVSDMEGRMQHRELSLNAPVKSDEEKTDWQDWIVSDDQNQEDIVIKQDELSKRRILFKQAIGALDQKERDVIVGRRLHEPPLKLHELAKKFRVSSERVRQIEKKAFDKMRAFIKKKNLLPTLQSEKPLYSF